MDAENFKALDELFIEIGKYKNSREYMDLLNFIAKFKKLSAYNAMLAHMQRPGAHFLLTAKKWASQFGANIKSESRPVVTLRPYGPVSFLYDVSDTDYGFGIPEYVKNPFQTSGFIDPKKYDSFEKCLVFNGVELKKCSYGSGQAGKISRLAKYKNINKYGENYFIYFTIFLSDKFNTNDCFATIIHEVGHMLCGHLGTPIPTWLPVRDSLSREQEEFEAESVSYIVCKREGIQTHSEKYLTSYMKNNESIPNISIDTILRTAEYIQEMIKNPSKKPKVSLDPNERKKETSSKKRKTSGKPPHYTPLSLLS